MNLVFTGKQFVTAFLTLLLLACAAIWMPKYLHSRAQSKEIKLSDPSDIAQMTNARLQIWSAQQQGVKATEAIKQFKASHKIPDSYVFTVDGDTVVAFHEPAQDEQPKPR